LAQDNGATQDLAAVNTSEGALKAQNGVFTDKTGLIGSKLISGLPSAMAVNQENAGAGYCASMTSPTGRTFVVASERTTPWEGSCIKSWKITTQPTVAKWASIAGSADLTKLVRGHLRWRSLHLRRLRHHLEAELDARVLGRCGFVL